MCRMSMREGRVSRTVYGRLLRRLRDTFTISFALQLILPMLSHVFRSPTLKHRALNPYLIVVLTFLAMVLPCCDKSTAPWNDLAAFFARIPGLPEVDTSGEKRWVNGEARWPRTAPPGTMGVSREWSGSHGATSSRSGEWMKKCDPRLRCSITRK
ncbi:hypothetical protein B0H12DRAFT_520450 [Mycena haematopus]|nr:hypothetical protein B0H12DRAFT_520450 [Mycena haematopus]